MFSNKGYRWKVGGAVVLIALLGIYGSMKGRNINPNLWRCIAEPKVWDGTTLWIPKATIMSVSEKDYEIEVALVRARVRGPSPAAVKESISLRAVFHADGPHLEPLRWHVLGQHDKRLRMIVEIVSILVLLLILANFFRHFLYRPKILQMEMKD